MQSACAFWYRLQDFRPRHLKYGKHLKNGLLINDKSCLINVNYSGKLLAQLFDGIEHDGYPIYAKYLLPMSIADVLKRDADFTKLDLVKCTTINGYQASTCFIQFKQCLNPSICDICTKTKLSSNIQQINPAIFLPPPFVFMNNTPEITLSDPTKLKKNYHFADLSLILALNIRLPKDHGGLL